MPQLITIPVLLFSDIQAACKGTHAALSYGSRCSAASCAEALRPIRRGYVRATDDMAALAQLPPPVIIASDCQPLRLTQTHDDWILWPNSGSLPAHRACEVPM